jgi:hypothetical protein
VITSKAANGYQSKTGQCEVAGTSIFYRVIACLGKANLEWPAWESDFELPCRRQTNH